MSGDRRPGGQRDRLDLPRSPGAHRRRGHPSIGNHPRTGLVIPSAPPTGRVAGKRVLISTDVWTLRRDWLRTTAEPSRWAYQWVDVSNAVLYLIPQADNETHVLLCST